LVPTAVGAIDQALFDDLGDAAVAAGLNSMAIFLVVRGESRGEGNGG
jgi:hypothetical protein